MKRTFGEFLLVLKTHIVTLLHLQQRLLIAASLLAAPEGGVVLDPFLGSGTTALSALRSGRSAIGIDLKPSYCEEAEQRITNCVTQIYRSDPP